MEGTRDALEREDITPKSLSPSAAEVAPAEIWCVGERVGD